MSNDFITLYNDQGRCLFSIDLRVTHNNSCVLVRFEAQKYEAWTGLPGQDIAFITSDIQNRLANPRKGWDNVRPAISTTVRAMFIASFMMRSMGNAARAVKDMKLSIDLLDWGLKKFKDIHVEDKGVVFSDTFVRGMRTRWATTMMEVSKQMVLRGTKTDTPLLRLTCLHLGQSLHIPSMTSSEPRKKLWQTTTRLCPCPLRLHQMAHQDHRGIFWHSTTTLGRMHSRESLDPSRNVTNIPKCSVKAFCLLRLAKLNRQDEDECKAKCREASACYVAAARLLP